MIDVFRPVNPVSDRNMFTFKITLFINRAENEWTPVSLTVAPHIQNVGFLHVE